MKLSILLALLSGIILISCSKKDTTPNADPGNTTDRIKSETGDWGTSSYKYDGSGRQITTDYSNGSKRTYEYGAGTVTEKYYNSSAVLTQTYVFELNSDGLVAKETMPGVPGFQVTNIYNSDKTLAKSVTLQNGVSNSIDYFYSNGNCDSSRHSTNGTWSLTIKNTYYTNKANAFALQNYGLSFFGKDDNNLQKTEQYTYPDGSALDMTTWTYEFDGQGRPVKQTSVRGANMEIIYVAY